MTPKQINQRIAQFERVVKASASKISAIGNKSWEPIDETTETATIRAFLTKKGAGVDYLNRNLARHLSKNGRVVKFAGLFLHGTPMVKGWTKTSTGKRKHNRACELSDLMTIFLYLDHNKTIKRMRCVMFQAKMQASNGAHVVEDKEQRKLYDECDGFDYVNATVTTQGDSRSLPKGLSRKKALQFMFVEPRPVLTRTIPSNKDKGQTFGYGDHLVRFLSGKTGLKSDTKKSAWGKIVWELMEKMAAQVYSDKKIRGPGVQGVLDHFNSFENHENWIIDEGQSANGFGVQLMFVWDGDMTDEQTQVQTKPKVPVMNIQAQEPTSLDEELETIESELEAVVVGIQG